MRNRIFTICILLTGFFLIGCIDNYYGGEDFKSGRILGLFIAEEKVDVAFYSSSGAEVMTAPTFFVATYKEWIMPRGEQNTSPRYGDLAGHRVQNNGSTPVYIFFEVAAERINGLENRDFPQFPYLPEVEWNEDSGFHQFNMADLPVFSAVLEIYRHEADCPDLAACEYVIIVPPGESRMFRYADE